MPKKIKNCFYEKLTFEKILEAHSRSRKNKTYKNEVIKFEMNLENNLINLLNAVREGKYESGEYRAFVVYEPKERIIKALPYVDRIVHQWYVEEFLKPYIIPKFIDTSYACLEGRGTHKAVETVQRYMQIYKQKYGDYWILKCDISKFFYSINPDILYRIMEKHISDKALLEFTRKLVFTGLDGGVGIPIGNYCSQYFANIYLNELDYYVKQELHVKYYVRYMDDFILLLENKEQCKEMKKKIEKFLNENLALKLNDKSRYYPSKMGVNFCGYRIFTTHRLLRTNSKKKIKANVKKWNKSYNKNELDIKKVSLQINSWKAHSSHCNSYKLQCKVYDSCEFFYNGVSNFEKTEKEIIGLIEKYKNRKKKDFKDSEKSVNKKLKK